MTSLPGKSGSCWTAKARPTDYTVLEGSIHAGTVVVGAGIVGLTTALRLCEEGREVVVLEGLRVGGQMTGRSTAKITTQHALIYRHLIDTLGLAAWRAESGELRAVSPTCTHKGCTVTWHNAERNWDCPCHGSIFAADGSVIHDPARKPPPPTEL